MVKVPVVVVQVIVIENMVLKITHGNINAVYVVPKTAFDSSRSVCQLMIVEEQ